MEKQGIITGIKTIWEKIIERLQKIWRTLKCIYTVLNIIRISIFMVCLSAILFLSVDQITDAIIALLESEKLFSKILFCFVGSLYALLTWYWARVFYYLTYYREEGQTTLKRFLIAHTPRFLGSLSLFIIAIAFLRQADYTISVFFFVLTFVFYLFVYYRKRKEPPHQRKVLKEELWRKHKGSDAFLLLKHLESNVPKRILFISTIIATFFLLFFIVWPNNIWDEMATVTVLLCCLCIWLSLLYWISYGSNRLKIPLFLLLFIIASIFSMFNQNKNVRLLPDTNRSVEKRSSITEYFDAWYKERKERYRPSDNEDPRIPLIIVLSEGGGIRAAYWSGGLLARLQAENMEFSSHLFAINGVSGGSFGAAVFAGLVKCQKASDCKAELEKKCSQDKPEEPCLQYMAGEIIGNDYLSPIVAAMSSRSLIQWIVPLPINRFDHGKVFEKKWENTWKEALKNTNYFSDPFLSLWEADPNVKKNSNFEIPALFINITRVDNGMPVLVSNLTFAQRSSEYGNIIEDFYAYSQNDIRLSTAALLSARFPYVSPAGILKIKEPVVDPAESQETARPPKFRERRIGFVDGGYFENTGANTAYEIYMEIARHFEKGTTTDPSRPSWDKLKPVIVYIKNGSQTENLKNPGGTLYSQFKAPIDTLFQTRDAHTHNAVSKIKEFVEMYNGQFIECSLTTKSEGAAKIPLGWALSETTQKRIDDRIDDIIGERTDGSQFTSIDSILGHLQNSCEALDGK